ncbi:MAG: nucleotidyltransferase family protein [Chloroflexi bacterium]|nr:nucleotidyltransferase family protein [Chloroflexota bacterium]MCI0796733.1 nucleotidyltransferase family protein [Chloroflexota bacterium]MCI0869501.1 nucleotidyltransferase family protein [Chloroflexota bacterium]
MDMKMLLDRHRNEILALAKMRGARNIRVFGSVARDEATTDSDVDILVDMEPGRSLLDLTGLQLDLEELLGRDVDVVTENGLSPYLKDRILAEATPI